MCLTNSKYLQGQYRRISTHNQHVVSSIVKAILLKGNCAGWVEVDNVEMPLTVTEPALAACCAFLPLGGIISGGAFEGVAG